MGYFPYIMKTFYIHIKLFKTLGYKLDLEKGEYPIEEPINIYKDNITIKTFVIAVVISVPVVNSSI